MKNTSSNTPIIITSRFEDWFFGDSYLTRLIRVFTILLVIFGWASLWAAIMEPYESLRELAWHALRYAVAPFAAMVSALFLGARFVQDIYELGSFNTGLKYLLATLFEGPPHRIIPLPSGLFLPSLTIADGDKDPEIGKENLIDKIGGPGWLDIAPGNVVVLELLDRESRVLGAGHHYISRYEHIKDILSLEDQSWDASAIKAITRDGFLVTLKGFQFGYRLASDDSKNGHTRRSLSDPYPFSIGAALTHAYYRSVNKNKKHLDWGTFVQFRLDSAITDYVNKSFLDQVLAPLIANNDPRSEMTKAITSPGAKAMLKSMAGAELLWQKIGEFEVETIDEAKAADKTEAIDKDENDRIEVERDTKKEIRDSIKEQRLKSWLAQWTGTAAVIRARGTAEKLSQEESGRAETTSVMLQSIMNALNETNGTEMLDDEDARKRLDENMWNIVLARTAQILESLTSFYGEHLDMPDINLGKKSEK